MAKDASMKIAELKNLKIEIEQELARVENLLHEVAQSCQAHPGDDDTIMKAIEATGNTLNEKWEQLCGTFKKVNTILMEVISGYAKQITQKLDDIGNMRKDL